MAEATSEMKARKHLGTDQTADQNIAQPATLVEPEVDSGELIEWAKIWQRRRDPALPFDA